MELEANVMMTDDDWEESGQEQKLPKCPTWRQFNWMVKTCYFNTSMNLILEAIDIFWMSGSGWGWCQAQDACTLWDSGWSPGVTRAWMSFWTAWGATWQHQMDLNGISQRCSIGFMLDVRLHVLGDTFWQCWWGWTCVATFVGSSYLLLLPLVTLTLVKCKNTETHSKKDEEGKITCKTFLFLGSAHCSSFCTVLLISLTSQNDLTLINNSICCLTAQIHIPEV